MKNLNSPIKTTVWNHLTQYVYILLFLLHYSISILSTNKRFLISLSFFLQDAFYQSLDFVITHLVCLHKLVSKVVLISIKQNMIDCKNKVKLWVLYKMEYIPREL